MRKKEINDFVNGKVSLALGDNGKWITESLSSEQRCPLCSRLIDKLVLRFKAGQRVLYDYINGTDGRCVGEGVIEEIRNNFWYSVRRYDGFYSSFRDCELNELKD